MRTKETIYYHTNNDYNSVILYWPWPILSSSEQPQCRTPALMLHSRAPWMAPHPEFRSGSSNFGVFMCIKSECGNNLDTKKKLFCNPEYHITNDVSQSFICKTWLWERFLTISQVFTFVCHVFASVTIIFLWLSNLFLTIRGDVHMDNPNHKSISGNKQIIAVLELDYDTGPTGPCTRQVSNYFTLTCAWSECLTHFITRRHDITMRFKSERVSVAVVSQSLTSALPALEKC